MPELHALLERDRLPSAQRWQRALDELGLPVTLDPATIVPDPGGALRATVAGKRVVIEFHTEPATAVKDRYPGLKGMFPTRDLAALFRYGSADPAESTAALGCLAALAQVAGAAWFDPAEGECYSADAALEKARAALALVSLSNVG